MQEKKGNQVKANLLTGLGLDEYFTRKEGNTTRTFLPDALGSTVALADNAGALQTQYTYEPFGKPTATGQTSTNTFKYTGREDDGTGLYYYRARYYHPGLQRFFSEDPLRFLGGDANFYGYVGNRPLSRVDPLGLAYVDQSFTAGFIFGVTFGWMVEGCKIYPYVGPSATTPWVGYSLTWSPSSPTTGWNVGLQGTAYASGQVGYSFGPGGGWFWEGGVGGGFPSPYGVTFSGYFVFSPWSNCPPGKSKSAR